MPLLGVPLAEHLGVISWEDERRPFDDAWMLAPLSVDIDRRILAVLTADLGRYYSTTVELKSARLVQLGYPHGRPTLAECSRINSSLILFSMPKDARSIQLAVSAPLAGNVDHPSHPCSDHDRTHPFCSAPNYGQPTALRKRTYRNPPTPPHMRGERFHVGSVTLWSSTAHSWLGKNGSESAGGRAFESKHGRNYEDKKLFLARSRQRTSERTPTRRNPRPIDASPG